jgi:hypothetical protein
MIRVLSHIVGTSLLLTAIGMAEPNPQDDQDPLAPPKPAPELKLAKGEFFTTTGLVVKPLNEWSRPESVPLNDLPEIKAPTTFNRAFEVPSKVWRVDGGFLASFDRGEFGGALFFAQHGSKRWTKIIDAFVQHLVCFEGDSYLVLGGLSHLASIRGEAFILSRNNNGKWKFHSVFKTDLGVPVVLGTTFTVPIDEAKAEKLVVIGLDSPWLVTPQFGISQQGTVHYLGVANEAKKNKESEPDGGANRRSMPIPNSDSKPAGSTP